MTKRDEWSLGGELGSHDMVLWYASNLTISYDMLRSCREDVENQRFAQNAQAK